jgi:hypothetical protein
MQPLGLVRFPIEHEGNLSVTIDTTYAHNVKFIRSLRTGRGVQGDLTIVRYVRDDGHGLRPKVNSEWCPFVGDERSQDDRRTKANETGAAHG